MDFTEQLRAWGAAHAQAREAETAARSHGPGDDQAQLQRRAASLRARADRLHGEAYRALGTRRDGPGR